VAVGLARRQLGGAGQLLQRHRARRMREREREAQAGLHPLDSLLLLLHFLRIARTVGTRIASSASAVSTPEIGRMNRMPIPASEMMSDWRSARSASGPSTSASTSAAGE